MHFFALLGRMHFRSETRLEGEELLRTLQSLACGVVGTRVLVKNPKGKDVRGGVYRYSDNFYASFRVLYPLIQSAVSLDLQCCIPCVSLVLRKRFSALADARVCVPPHPTYYLPVM